MQRPRFTFLAMPATPEGAGDRPGHLISWVLASSNQRLLARANTSFDSYSASYADLLRLREGLDRVDYVTVAIPDVARWIWRASIDGTAMAVASRSYLRVRECHYSLGKFKDAVGTAEVNPEIRIVDSGHMMHRRARAQAAHDSFGVH